MKLSRRHLSQSALAVGLSYTTGSHAAPKEPQQPALLVLRGATLYRAGQPPLKDSVVLVEGSKIKSIAAGNAAIPKGARALDLHGKVLTGGLIDPVTSVGLTEVSLEKQTRDVASQSKHPIRAAFEAADGYNPASSLLAIARQQGLTSVVTTPRQGLICGHSAWADLAGSRHDLARRRLALHLCIHGQAMGSSGMNRGDLWLMLRRLIADAKDFQKDRRAYQRRQLRHLSVSRLDLEAILRVLDGTVPLVVHVDRASDILQVLAFGKRHPKLRLVLASVAEGWKVAGDIQKSGRPAIVYPLDHGPRDFSALGAREDNAALLSKAGVALALSTGESHNARKLRQVAGNAVRAGMSHQAAIAAISDTPARIFGMSEHGSPGPKRLANLVVWSGDPLEISSRAERMFIRGKSVSLRSRQTALFERYR